MPREAKITVGIILAIAGVLVIREWWGSVVVVLQGLLGWVLLLVGGLVLLSGLQQMNWTALERSLWLRLQFLKQQGRHYASNAIRRCPQCHARTEAGARFCVDCGAALP